MQLCLRLEVEAGGNDILEQSEEETVTLDSNNQWMLWVLMEFFTHLGIWNTGLSLELIPDGSNRIMSVQDIF
jgi:hypothetical protein